MTDLTRGGESADRVPALLPEYLKQLLGSLIGFQVISWTLKYLFHANSLYALPILALVYSLQATWYKYRLSVDPEYSIPNCGCAGRARDDTERVLRSSASATLGVPNSLLGAILYAALLLLVFLGHTGAALQLAILAVVVSGYLGYQMVVRIGGLCGHCINLAALNLLILWRLAG